MERERHHCNDEYINKFQGELTFKGGSLSPEKEKNNEINIPRSLVTRIKGKAIREKSRMR